MKLTRFGCLITLSALAACATAPDPENGVKSMSDPQTVFMTHLVNMCGKSFEGAVISNDAADADWRKEKLVIHVRDCDSDRVAIPLHVGDDRSRTWIVSRADQGLRLKHDHRHEDGLPDAVTLYGGDTQNAGTETYQAFPADDYSKALFEREFLTDSVNNIWSLSIDPDTSLTYYLKRPGRDFRARFDLTQTVQTPPPVWGYEPPRSEPEG